MAFTDNSKVKARSTKTSQKCEGSYLAAYDRVIDVLYLSSKATTNFCFVRLGMCDVEEEDLGLAWRDRLERRLLWHWTGGTARNKCTRDICNDAGVIKSDGNSCVVNERKQSKKGHRMPLQRLAKTGGPLKRRGGHSWFTLTWSFADFSDLHDNDPTRFEK